jgi:hypothetical protein
VDSPVVVASSSGWGSPSNAYYPNGGTAAWSYAPSLGVTTAPDPYAILAKSLRATGGSATLLPPPTPVGQRVPQAIPAPTPSGTFRYDGGPTTPVPMPTADPPGATPPKKADAPGDQPAAVIPISLPGKKPFKYPAYGDKR